MTEKIFVAILDDHQAIIDGYQFRLMQSPDIQITATLRYGEALEPTLEQKKVDVLLLDLSLPTSPENLNPYPILYLIPKLLQKYPNLSIVVISMYAQQAMISALMEAGISGYVLKEDHAAIRDLASLIRTVYEGGIYLSQNAHKELWKRRDTELELPLSNRQLEALSLCAAYPNASSLELAEAMSIANSTLRNLLSNTYMKLGVNTRAAAIARARQLGLIAPDT